MLQFSSYFQLISCYLVYIRARFPLLNNDIMDFSFKDSALAALAPQGLPERNMF